MHLRFCCARLLGCALIAAALLAAVAAPRPAAAQAAVSVYGLELDVDAERERLLIFADGPLEPELIEVDAGTLMLALPGAVLDPTAPTRLAPEVAGTVRRVTAFERAGNAGRPEVRVVVQRRAGAEASVERRAAMIAVDFEPLRRATPPTPADTVSITYRNAPLARVVREIAQATGETIVLDDTVSGTITVEGPSRATRGEALALLDSLLLMRNLAAVPAPGGFRKIVQISGAEGPWVRELPEGDELVATLLRVESASADDLLAVLSGFFGSQTVALAYPPTNSLMLVGPGSVLRRVRTAVEALDQADRSRPVVWRLRYADAEMVAAQLDEVLGERTLRYVAGDVVSNTLLLRVEPEDLERVRALVDRLDRPASASGELHVVPLRYADPSALAERLIALRDDEAPVREGAAAQQAGLRGREFLLAADVPTHSLLVQASPEAFRAVLDVVQELDRVPDSIRVELTVATLRVDSRLDVGFDFLIPSLTTPRTIEDAIVTVAATPSGLPTTTGPDLPFLLRYARSPISIPILDPVTGAVLGAFEIPRESASLSLNGRRVDTNTLMRPQLLLTGGEEHELFVGNNVPIRRAQATTAAAGDGIVDPVGTVRQDIERHDVGTRVRLLPTLGAEGGVLLELDLEQSEIGDSLAGDTETVGPSIRKIEVQSRIRLRTSETAVVATALEPATSRRRVGVPWLMDVPVLGWLFRVDRDQAMKSYLLVAVRAEIVSAEQRELARTLARELARADAEAEPTRR